MLKKIKQLMQEEKYFVRLDDMSYKLNHSIELDNMKKSIV